MPEREISGKYDAQLIYFHAVTIGPEVAKGFTMILLVTPSGRASECAVALHEAMGEEVTVAETLARATTFLRAEDYLAVVLDQYVLETESDAAGIMFAHSGTAVTVQVNLAITGIARLVREVRAAMQRRQHEESKARQTAIGRLQSELNDTVTALLLSSELVLETPGLPAMAAEKLRSLYELVKKLRAQIESGQPATESVQAVKA